MPSCETASGTASAANVAVFVKVARSYAAGSSVTTTPPVSLAKILDFVTISRRPSNRPATASNCSTWSSKATRSLPLVVAATLRSSLHPAISPNVPKESWRLTIDGLVKNPVTLTWADFLALEQTSDVSDFHCVTTWSKMDMDWKGVRFSDLAALVEPHDEVAHVLCHAYDGYTTNVPMVEALKPDVLLVHTALGEPLAQEHGGPVRMITPQLYAWKGAKWIKRIEFLAQDRPGFWEVRGYSNTAHPWREDRFG